MIVCDGTSCQFLLSKSSSNQSFVQTIHFFSRIKVKFDSTLSSTFMNRNFGSEGLLQSSNGCSNIWIDRLLFRGRRALGTAIVARYQQFRLAYGVIALNDLARGVEYCIEAI